MLVEIYNEKISQPNELIYSEFGGMTFEKLQDILSDLEKRLVEKLGESPYVRKLYTVSVEILQNIYHHADFDDEQEKSFFFIIYKKDNFIKIISANIVEETSKQVIKSRIDQINILEANDLRELYLRILNDRKFTVKGGGSLGIIDIKRKTKQKLFYSFIKLNHSKFIFIFEVSIKAKKHKKNEVINY